MKQVKDQLGRLLSLVNSPKRIVSLVPSLTELLCDLGLKESLVGITKFCVHPKGLRQDIRVVGGTKQVHYDIIQSLNPDIILCNKEENTLDIVESCASIAPVHVSDIYTVEDCLQLIELYGELFAVEENAQQIINNISEAQKSFETFVKEQERLKVAYFIWKKPWMVVGNNTFIHHLLEKNKFDNVFSGIERYPSVALDDLRLNEVDLILLSSEPYPFKLSDRLQMEEKCPHAKVLIVDGEMFSWYGSRLIKAFSYFKQLHTAYIG